MTAEVLIRAEATPHLTSGSILAIKPEGHQWGTEELTDRFIRVTVTGASAQDLEQYLEVAKDASGDVIHKRRFHINPALVNQIVANGGDLTVNLSNVNLAMVDKDG